MIYDAPHDWKRRQTIKIIIAVGVLGAAAYVLRSRPRESTTIAHVGEHMVTIIETGREGGGVTHIGGTPKETWLLTYRSAKLDVRLEDEVLTVNGRKYVIPRKDDSIRITDGRVEINGQPPEPEGAK